MKPHTKLYYQFFDYVLDDCVKSELSNEKAVDIHHIDCRKKGGSKEKDFIENLIALTRDQHDKFGDKKQHMVYLYTKHLEFIRLKRPDYKIKFEKIPEAYRDEVVNNLKFAA